MKVFFLIRSLDCGGAERQLIVLSKGLCERGHDVVIGTFYAGGPLEKELADTKVKIVPLNKSGRWDVFRFMLRLIQTVREERPDVLHGYLWDPNLFAVALKPLFPNIKVVWGIRSSGRNLSKETWLERLSIKLNYWLSRFADVIVANSQVGHDDYLAQGFPGEKMVVIPNGVDTQRFQPNKEIGRSIRSEWGLTERHNIIGLVGRLSPVKDHPNFLKAAALLVKERRDVRFVCVGNGPQDYRRKLEAIAEELELKESLIWSVGRQDISAVYNALDCLVSSSYSEGLSNVITEAMACGVPCVVTNVGDSAWIVSDTGEVVPPKDPLALKNAISRLLKQKPCGQTRIRQRIIDLLSIDNLVDNTERTLSALLADPLLDVCSAKALSRPPVNP